MAKNKDPAFMFYPADFMIGTFFMTNEEVGRYIRMLCLQHQQGRLSAEEMDSMCGDSSKIRAKFVMDENGMYYNERLDEEIAKRSEYKEKQRQYGSQGGKKRSTNAQATIKAPLSDPQATLKLPSTTRVGNENRNINIDSNNKTKNTSTNLYNKLRATYIYSERINNKVLEWLQYKSERREPYKETGLKVLLRRIENSALEYGDEAVCDVIDDSIANGWKGIVFDKLGAARNAPTQGGKAKTDKECSVPRYSTFDAEEALQAALEKSYRDINREI